MPVSREERGLHLTLHRHYQILSSSSSHHLSLNREGRWSTTDDFETSFLHSSLFSTALWDLANSRPVHFLMLSSHLFLCLPCLLPLFTVPCKLDLAKSNERETWPYHCSLRLFTMVRRSSCGPIACWILARTSSLVTWSLYEMRTHQILYAGSTPSRLRRGTGGDRDPRGWWEDTLRRYKTLPARPGWKFTNTF